MNIEASKNEAKICTICRIREGVIVCHNDNLSVVKCEKCGLYYVDAQTLSSELLINEERISYERGEEYLKTVYGNKTESWLRYYSDWVKMFERFCDGRRLLDVGCGAGYLVRAAIDRGWDANGIDTSSDAINFGKNTLSLNGNLFDDSQSEKIFGDTYDVVTLFSVIEHVSDPYTFLLDIRNSIKSEGIVFIKTPSQDSLITKLHWFMYKISRGKIDLGLYNREHIYRFSHDTLHQLLEKIGFSIEYKGFDDQLWITKTRYLLFKRYRFIRNLTLTIIHVLGNFLEMPNQLVVIARKNTSI